MRCGPGTSRAPDPSLSDYRPNPLASQYGLSYPGFFVNDDLHKLPERPTQPHRRRPRYSGKYPRRFEEKYKEQDPARFSETIKKVLDSGKTPAGTHRAIMVEEVLTVLAPRPGERVVDCTLGYGGHARALLEGLVPGGHLIGFDQDPIELAKVEARMRSEGFGPDVLTAHRSNFAALARVLAKTEISGVDIILADLGVSSMQLDNPARGFSVKFDGPLDMRMNPNHGQSASSLLETIQPDKIVDLLSEGADEPFAQTLGKALAGCRCETTAALAARIRKVLTRAGAEEVELSIRRTFQALRIAVNDEFSALDALLRQAPGCLNPGGRIAILSFHSGEDRRVKKAFAAGFREGVYSEVAPEVIRPTAAERHANPRSAAAKLRWARKAAPPVEP
jgi:16S rRNA (cytosine1402-N4)-methyltransferase